jgi:hypothetical protein
MSRQRIQRPTFRQLEHSAPQASVRKQLNSHGQKQEETTSNSEKSCKDTKNHRGRQSHQVVSIQCSTISFLISFHPIHKNKNTVLALMLPEMFEMIKIA